MRTTRSRQSAVKAQELISALGEKESSPEPAPAGTTKAKTTSKPKTSKATKKKSKEEKSVEVEEKEAEEEPKKDLKEDLDNDDDNDQEDDNGHIFYELNEKELKEINAAFDHNSSDDAEELMTSSNLKIAMRALGFEPRADEIKRLLKQYSGKSGKINRQGFHKIMTLKLSTTAGVNTNHVNDEISRVFNLLDLDKTGLITLENLRSIAKELNEEITDEELHEMITEADSDGDFQINKEEFENIMKKTSLY